MTCPKCKDTGMVYVGNGHRHTSYPYAEQHAADTCSCDLGRALDRGERIPMPPAEQPDPEKVAAYKANLDRRIDFLVAKHASTFKAIMARINGESE